MRPFSYISALLALAFIALPSAQTAPLDRLETVKGESLEGRLVSDSGDKIEFLVSGEKRPRRLRHRDIARLELELPTLAEHRADPNWSDEQVAARLERDFTEEFRDQVLLLRSKHYILFSLAPGGAKGARKFIARDMEEIYSSFADTFPFEEPESAPLLPVFLLKDHEQYARWSMGPTGWDYAAARASAGHAYMDYYATYFTGSAISSPTVWHEAAHQLVGNRLNIHGGGSWFQEGLAVYFEDKYKHSENVESLAPGMIGSERYTHFRELFEVKSLLHSSGDNKKGSIAGQRYLQSGTIIFFLAEGPWKDKFGSLLAAVRDWRGFGSDTTRTSDSMWDVIFRRVYGLDIDGVEAAWKKWFGK
ncbi:MAG: DUF1570 domain-containing protein [Planctomycetota bacterium]|jgi:hypothetical protein|nr:DUF1570 domain-containing protein [Planctomycetota bacterium]MDP6518911.1 DUF1570 domain-containing protein [Planctomycetota bacterium]MDP6839004.1 DUF1570 domain-containing protein [Planctomycetota bacterium]